MEMEPISLPTRPGPTKGNAVTDDTAFDRMSVQASANDNILGELGGSGPNATPRAEAAQRWNDSKANIFKMSSTFLCFFVTGANDAAYGVSIASTIENCFFANFIKAADSLRTFRHLQRAVAQN